MILEKNIMSLEKNDESEAEKLQKESPYDASESKEQTTEATHLHETKSS
jgi:hypothetical protein